jgi:hypothetical protein
MNQMFDIDLVYLWVDGNDPVWLNKKNVFLGESPKESEVSCKGRFANNDELRYSLRTAEKYAPWIRKIFIVTDKQVPDWLDTTNPKIKIIDHTDILPAEALPCYNSVVIEYFLYKIPNLAEHFLYANDDMFFNAQITPDFFFAANGYPIVRLQRVFLGKWINRLRKTLKIHTNIYRQTIEKSAKLIEKKSGKYYSGTPHHNVDAYLKTDFQNVVEQEFYSEISPTVTNHTRSENDVQRIIFLYYLLSIRHGSLRYVGRTESCRIRLHNPNFMKFITRYQPKLFCLNDSNHASDEDRARIKPFLEKLFPLKTEFEK